MKEFWEDEHFLYDEDEENNKNVYWQDFLGGVILLSILFFAVYGVVSFIIDVF